ncbi:hypothetical protein KR009_005095 [Drosophila setifemur]|nr:hypothetical protein KR009_005095 [Drosophila setifemur]
MAFHEGDHRKDHVSISQEKSILESSSTRIPEKELNTFWISVSGYPTDRAYNVYRFFYDIGHIVGKTFTKSNIMYLKYLSTLDCQIALSYNAQKIGYGGDIRVDVKLENPVTENPIIEVLEECMNDDSFASETYNESPMEINIDVEEVVVVKKITSHQLEIGKSSDTNFQKKGKKVGLLQWFKDKLSYVFYFY